MQYRFSQLISFCFFAFLLSMGAVHAQNIDSLLNLQRQVDPNEKVYVQTDKSYYNPGETIWLKAYIFDGFERSLGSRNFYAELLDDNGALLDKKTAPIAVSGAIASFTLPAAISKNIVYIRAYTVASLNGDSSFICTKAIRIITTAKKILNTTNGTDIKFLPEGGDLVAGLPSKIAFKAIHPNGTPATVIGVVKAADGTKLADIKTLHNGMGMVNITPMAGQTYTATWKDENRKEYTTSLPAAKADGIVLTVTDDEVGKKFTVERTDNASDGNKSLMVVGIIGQQMAYQAKINLTNKNTVSSTIPTNDLPTGILQITVFDKNMKPVAERITFVNNHDYEMDADAWLPQINTDKRGLNKGEVMISDTLLSNLSIAVTDADLNSPAPYEDNIISHMLLSGDLRGNITNPYYYFYSTADSVGIQLDLVMLTNGWRRYNWNNVLAAKLPETIFQENNFLTVGGKVINVNRGAFPANTLLNGFIRTSDSVSTFISLPIERNGNIQSSGYVFYDTARLYLQMSNKNIAFDKSMFVASNGLLQYKPSIPINDYSKWGLRDLDTALLAQNLLKNKEALRLAAKIFKDAHELNAVTVTAKARPNTKKLDEEYTSGLFSGSDAKSFDVANDPSASGSLSIFQYLQGKVAGLQISTADPSNPSLTWRGGSPTLYLNEMAVEAEQLSNISVADIAYVKVFSPGSAGVIRTSGGGAISVYTKKGGASGNVESKLSAIIIAGYSNSKEFYSPDYATLLPEHNYDDLRTTLYWEPFIILGKNKKRFKFQFYNSDITKRFRLVLEGINDAGKLVHVEKLIGGNN